MWQVRRTGGDERTEVGGRSLGWRINENCRFLLLSRIVRAWIQCLPGMWFVCVAGGGSEAHYCVLGGCLSNSSSLTPPYLVCPPTVSLQCWSSKVVNTNAYTHHVLGSQTLDIFERIAGLESSQFRSPVMGRAGPQGGRSIPGPPAIFAQWRLARDTGWIMLGPPQGVDSIT
ncbi:hypothetical protein RRG08_058659 [Elysia crispata]|uniref:Uncharacterized protein n=1 Tax=Elysia crispata TaxID=231223 RepID=A0AAE0Z203_9GAST|nr:hypothetical protein RRG08_058659 [Elysia crispata]